MEGDINWAATDFFRKILLEILSGDDFTNTTTVEVGFLFPADALYYCVKGMSTHRCFR